MRNVDDDDDATARADHGGEGRLYDDEMVF
jgi:hypothetical protein